MRSKSRQLFRTCFTATIVTVALMTGVASAQDVPIFISSQTTNGNLGGLTGGDSFCQDLGTAAFPGSGPWVAWLSDSTTNAVDRVPSPGAGGAYVRAAEPGTVIAATQADLIAGSVSNSILLDENGVARDTFPLYWARTGTTSGGIGVADNCSDWTASVGPNGLGGNATSTNITWTHQFNGPCNEPYSLYCVGEPLAAVPAASPWSIALLAMLLAGGLAVLVGVIATVRN